MTQTSMYERITPGPQRNKPGAPRCGSPKSRGRGPCESPIIYKNGRCKKHNGKAKRGHSAPNYRHGRRSKYGVYLGESTLGHLWLKFLKSDLCQWLIRNAIFTAFEKLGIADLAPFVIAETVHEVSRLEEIVESGVEVQTLPPPQRRPSVGRAAEQIERLRKRVERKWLSDRSRRSRSRRQSKWKRVEMEKEPEATHTPAVPDREAIELMAAAIRGAMADLEASHNH